MDRIFIKNLSVRGVIGVNQWERENAQEILINITLGTDLTRAGKSDDLADTVNYQAIARRVQAHAENAARLTVEALATDIAIICLEERSVEQVEVRVEKPRAVAFTESVGVEIVRRRQV
jgi:FolB domain-containing protein